jgi:hypothetical protein
MNGHLGPLRQYPDKWYLQGTDELGDETAGAGAVGAVGVGDDELPVELGELLPMVC